MIHLIIHFDINETILIGDDAGGDTYEECIHKIIAKSAFVKAHHDRTDSTGSTIGGRSVSTDSADIPLAQNHRRFTSKVVPTHWWDGSPIRTKENGPVDHSEMITPHQFEPIPSLWTQWEWPNNACPYYRTSNKKLCHNFTHHDGSIYYQSHFQKIYRSLHPNRWDKKEECEEKDLDTSSGVSSRKGDSETSQMSNKNVDHNNPDKTHKTMAQMLPAFFDTMIELNEWCKTNSATTTGMDDSPASSPPSQHPVGVQHITIVLRTFGSDLHPVMNAIQLFIQGQHPEYPNVQFEFIANGSHTPNNIVRGRWVERITSRRNENDAEGILTQQVGDQSHSDNFEYQLMDENDEVIAAGDANVIQWLHSMHENKDTNGNILDTTMEELSNNKKNDSCRISICGIQDDYDHWSKYHCVPWAGKPVWKLLPPPLTSPRRKDDILDCDNHNNNNNNGSYNNVQYHHVLFDDNMYVYLRITLFWHFGWSWVVAPIVSFSYSLHHLIDTI